MFNKLYKHNDKLYVILRVMKTHQVTGNNGIINMELLKAWRDYEGADHVLRDGDTYLLCETVEEAQIIE